MRPLPETLGEPGSQGDVALGPPLTQMARRVGTAVPDLLGLAVRAVERGVTSTLVTSHDELAALDAVQYLDGGPGVAAAEDGSTLTIAGSDLLAEGRWPIYARASTSLGIAATVSLPIVDADRVVGSISLYASTGDAFDGHQSAIVEAIASDARHAVSDTDLSARTARLAVEAPAKLREGGELNIALALISEVQRVNLPIARRRLQEAAGRAGVTELEAAHLLSRLRTGEHRQTTPGA